MDSRDIIEEPIKVVGGKYLECMYSLQKELLEQYIKVEGLPQYPIDVNTKKSQIILKDFVGRVIEELAEGYEALILVSKLTEKNKLWKSDYEEEEYTQCLNHLQNAGEEMADAMHFMLELLIYSNIQAKDIEDYLDNWLKDKVSFGVTKTLPTLAKAMQVGLSILYNDPCNMVSEPKAMNKTYLLEEFESMDEDSEDPRLVNKRIDTRFHQCGKFYNKLTYSSYKYMMWDVTYHLNIARNFLKNKPWKQSQMMTNEGAYQEEIVKAFILMMGLFLAMGISPENLYFLYFKKNRVNKFRIESKY
jgi:hypothetical protein